MTVNPRRPVTTRSATGLGNVQPVPGTGGSSKDTGKSAELMNAGRSGSGWKKSSAEDRAEAMVEVEARKAMLLPVSQESSH